MATATVLGLRGLTESVCVSHSAGHVVNTRKRGALQFRGGVFCVSLSLVFRLPRGPTQLLFRGSPLAVGPFVSCGLGLHTCLAGGGDVGIFFSTEPASPLFTSLVRYGVLCASVSLPGSEGPEDWTA